MLISHSGGLDCFAKFSRNWPRGNERQIALDNSAGLLCPIGGW
jgi:hypothetical protein